MAAKQHTPHRPPAPVLDRRVDTVGYVKDLVRLLAAPLIDAIKKGHKVGDVVFGETYTGTLQGCTERHLSPAQLLRLYEAKGISRSQFIQCMGPVKVAQAEKVLDNRTFRKLCSEKPGEPRLVVKDLAEGREATIEEAIAFLVDRYEAASALELGAAVREAGLL